MTDTVTYKPGDYVIANQYAGVAFQIRRYHVEHVYDNDPRYDEPEEIVHDDRFVCVMVGDDREHIYDAEELEPLDPDEFCPGCGQTGCGHYR